MRNGSKYSCVSFKNSQKYIHKLVWETWVGAIPDGMDIMHDDTAPLQEDNSYRNWLCDLSIGTRVENMISFHTYKNTQETQEQQHIFIENVPDISLLEEECIFPNNPIGELMRNAPQGINFVRAKIEEINMCLVAYSLLLRKIFQQQVKRILVTKRNF